VAIIRGYYSWQGVRKHDFRSPGEILSLISRKNALIIGLMLLLIVSSIRIFNNIGIRLAQNDAPLPADLIICLNGQHRIAKAVQLYEEGLADKILLTVDTTGKVLIRKGVPSNAIELAPGVRTTFEEALAAREYVHQNPSGTALVISDPYHLWRVRWSFEKAFQGMDTHLVFVASDLFWPRHDWFHDPFARYQVASELSKMLFYRIYHGLLGRKTAPEWVFAWKTKYLGFLRKALSF
jgi:uncharacterized SAM-binding protein YcdF (DUF218 family)